MSNNSASIKSTPIKGASLGKPFMYVNSFGDTWTNTWADDDNIYTLSDDTKGWYEGCGSGGSNLAINRLTGKLPYYDNLDGETINPMKTGTSNFGKWAELKYDSDGIKRMWKGNGLSFIDGALYLTVSRHRNGDAVSNFIQYVINASIIKSVDYGKTWTATEEKAFNTPMFPSTNFCTPFFIEYGKDGKIPDGQGGWILPPHGADRFVYAVSSDVSWNNGNYMKLGRVERSKLGDLNPADWQFYIGHEGDEEGGMNDTNWSSLACAATAFFHNIKKIGMAGIQYIWPLKRYVMLQWYHPNILNFPDSDLRYSHYTGWHFYESPTPWGPWTKFYEYEYDGTGFYNPHIISKSITYDDKSHSCNMTVLTAGDWSACTDPDTVYRMHAIQLNLTTR